jgi:hypothetical protein
MIRRHVLGLSIEEELAVRVRREPPDLRALVAAHDVALADRPGVGPYRALLRRAVAAERDGQHARALVLMRQARAVVLVAPGRTRTDQKDRR